MDFDRDKFKAWVLYAIWRTSHYESFGATKLNKALWFPEARSFQAYGKPITGETFLRDKYGPRSKHLAEILLELEADSQIEPFEEHLGNFIVKRHRVLVPAPISTFTKEELGLIDWWIHHIAEDHSASSISRFSHDYAWEIAEIGEELPLHSFLASRIRPPQSDEEKLWAREQAKLQGDIEIIPF